MQGKALLVPEFLQHVVDDVCVALIVDAARLVVHHATGVCGIEQAQGACWADVEHLGQLFDDTGYLSSEGKFKHDGLGLDVVCSDITQKRIDDLLVENAKLVIGLAVGQLSESDVGGYQS